MRRRNGGMTADKLIGALREWKKGLSGEAAIDADALIAMVEGDPDVAQTVADAVSAKLAARAAASGGGAAAAASSGSGSGELTDAEGWTMLAGLVDSALSELTADERAAIKSAFMAEAARS